MKWSYALPSICMPKRQKMTRKALFIAPGRTQLVEFRLTGRNEQG